MTASCHRRSVIGTLSDICVVLLLSGCTGQPPPLPPPVSTAAQPCPQWAEYPRDKHSNADSPYLGCTTAFNLRAMLANPQDLEHGRPLGPADGERESRAIEAYRQGKVKPFQGSGTTAAAAPASAGSAGP